ncbi:MAG: hypothetical protein AB7F64_04205 [Gammaproteobacteria bacterium]
MPKMKSMSDSDFLRHHIDIMKLISVKPILTIDDWSSHDTDPEQVFADLKNKLA